MSNLVKVTAKDLDNVKVTITSDGERDLSAAISAKFLIEQTLVAVKAAATEEAP